MSLVDRDGWTPLQMAAQNYDAEMAGFLLDAGAFVDPSSGEERPLQDDNASWAIIDLGLRISIAMAEISDATVTLFC